MMTVEGAGLCALGGVGAGMRAVGVGICCRGCGFVCLGRGLGGLGLRAVGAFVAEGAGLCAVGGGWGRDGCGWCRFLRARVQNDDPWAWVVWVGVVVGGGICCRGCSVVLPGHGLGGLGLRPAGAPVVEGAVWCSLGV